MAPLEVQEGLDEELDSQDAVKLLWRNRLKALKFIAIGGLGYFEGLGLFYMMTRWLGVFDLWALTIVTGIVAFTNFLGNVALGNIKLDVT